MFPEKVYFQVFRKGNYIDEYIVDLCDNTFVVQEILKVEILAIEDRNLDGEFEVEVRFSSRERPTIALSDFGLYENIAIKEMTESVNATIALDGYTFAAEAVTGSFKIDVNKNGALDPYEIFGVGDSFTTVTGDCIETRSYTITAIEDGSVTLKPDVRELMNVDDFDLQKMIETIPVSGEEIYMYALIENVGNYRASDVVVSVDHFGYELLNYCDVSSNYLYVGDLEPGIEAKELVWDTMEDDCHSNDSPCTEQWEVKNEGNFTVKPGYIGDSLEFANDANPGTDGELFVDLDFPDNFTEYDTVSFWTCSGCTDGDANKNNEDFWFILTDENAKEARWSIESPSETSSTESLNWEIRVLRLDDPDIKDPGFDLSKIENASFLGLNDAEGDGFYRFDHILLRRTEKGGEKKVVLLRLRAPRVSYEEYHPITIGVNYKMAYVNDEGDLVEENFQEEFKRDINVYPKTVQLRIKQFVSYKELILGEESDVTVTVENIGDLTALNLEITDYLPAGLELVEGEASQSVSELLPGESTEFSYRMKAKELGDYELITKVQYNDERGELYEMQSFPIPIIVYKEFPRLDLRKNIDKTAIVVNEHIIVVLVLTNTGNKPAKEIVLVDSIPEEFSLTSSKEEGITGDVNVFKIERMDPDDKRVFSYVIKADEPGKYTLKGCKVRYSDYENNSFEYEAPDVNIDVTGLPELDLNYSLSRETVQDGELLTVKGVVTNIGNGLAKNITVEHAVSVGEVVDGELIQEIAALKSGEHTVHKFTVRVPVSNTTYDFQVTVAHTCYDLLENEYADEEVFIKKIDAKRPKIEITRTVEQMIIKQNRYYVDAGYSFIISIVATNTGTADAVDLILEESLPENLEVINGTNTWEGDLKVGESKVITYTSVGEIGGVYSLAPSAFYGDKWGVSYSDTGKTLQFTLRGLDITKNISKNEANVGDTIGVSVSIRNYGDTEATDIFIEDTVPAGFELVEGEITAQSDLLQGNETMNIAYTLKAATTGDFTLEKAVVRWKNPYGESRQLESGEYAIIVKELPPPPTSTAPPTTTVAPPVYERYISTVLLILVGILIAIVAIVGVRAYRKRRFEVEEEELFEELEIPEEEEAFFEELMEEKTPTEMFEDIELPAFEEEEEKSPEAPDSIKKVLEWQEKEEERKKGEKGEKEKKDEGWHDRDYTVTDDMTPREILKGKKKKKEDNEDNY
jgi:uncharacterized repeat protein (TIGR01451 family)